MGSSKSKVSSENTEPQGGRSGQISLFPLGGRPVSASFSLERVSSDGGALLLREVDNFTGLLEAFAGAISDGRDQRYVKHGLVTMLRQRVFQIACGYEDANDCNTLKADPVFKVCAGQSPFSSGDLSSQPTMSRLENSVTRTDLYRVAVAFGERFVASYPSEPPIIFLDCDDTDNEAHGGQQGCLFNGYYGEHCLMPMHIFEGQSGKHVTTVLRPGRRAKGAEALSILRRVIGFIRLHWKNTVIVMRGDGHFCSHEFMEWAAGQRNVHFITGLAGNAVLLRNVETTLKSAKGLFERKHPIAIGSTVKLYHSFTYKAGSWKMAQHVVAKVEYSPLGANIRFIVTDLKDYRASHLYEKGYCVRGNAELMIKDHKLHLKSDRSSCHRFEANQFRLFLHSAAYILIHTLQKEALHATELVNATMRTVQLKLLKVAAKVTEFKTRIRVEFPVRFPGQQAVEAACGVFAALRSSG